MSDEQKSNSNDESSALSTHINDPRRDAINQWAFETYARDWAIRRGFFPVFRWCEDNTIRVKLYYEDRISNDSRQLKELVASFYYQKLDNLPFSWIKFETFIFKGRIPESKILNCKSIYELEEVVLTSLKYFNDPNGLDSFNMTYIDKKFDYWNDLISDGYLDAEYEKKCRDEGIPLPFTSFRRTKGEKLYIKIRRYTIVENADGTYAIERIKGRGFEQPEVMTAEEIDALYYKHIAQRHAIEHGFVVHFISFDGSTIYIKLITDPRYNGQLFREAKFMSYFLRSSFGALSGGSNFTAYHYHTTGIIGYKIPENATPEEIAQLEAERLRTYAELPDEPTSTFHGLAKPF